MSVCPQINRLNIEGGIGALDYVEFVYEEELVLYAQETVAAMGIGINLGNTLDAPAEGEWATPAEKHHLEDFREAGFTHVRSEEHTSELQSRGHLVCRLLLDKKKQ